MYTNVHSYTHCPVPPTPSLCAALCIRDLKTDISYNEQKAHKASAQLAAILGHSVRLSQVTLR